MNTIREKINESIETLECMEFGTKAELYGKLAGLLDIKIEGKYRINDNTHNDNKKVREFKIVYSNDVRTIGIFTLIVDIYKKDDSYKLKGVTIKRNEILDKTIQELDSVNWNNHVTYIKERLDYLKNIEIEKILIETESEIKEALKDKRQIQNISYSVHNIVQEYNRLLREAQSYKITI